MKLVSVIVAMVLVLSSSNPNQEVEVYQVEQDGKIELYGKNPNSFPVTIELNIDYKNLRLSRQVPFAEVINARTDKKLLDLDIAQNNVKWEFSTNYSYYMGSIFAKHDDSYAYRLPYKPGTSQRVAQGYNGTFSHQGKIRYSIDFNLDEDTEVYAARDGIVVETESKFNEGGQEDRFLDRANYITILHSDGTFADYSHLRRGGVVVQVNQRVRAGQLIGYSGSTGFVSGPHLHFDVKNTIRGGGFETIPVKFLTKQGARMLQQGQSYTAF